MKATIEFDDLRTNTRQKLESLAEIVHADGLAPERRIQLFEEQATSLMTLMHAAMTLTGIASRKAAELDEVADTWKSLVELCDSVLLILSKLHQENPQCVGGYFYDKALDYRNAANSRYLMHA